MDTLRYAGVVGILLAFLREGLVTGTEPRDDFSTDAVEHYTTAATGGVANGAVVTLCLVVRRHNSNHSTGIQASVRSCTAYPVVLLGEGVPTMRSVTADDAPRRATPRPRRTW